MASLMSEILKSAGKSDKSELLTEAEKVTMHIEDAKLQVLDFLCQDQSYFEPLLENAKKLAETSSDVNEDIQYLLGRARSELKAQLQCSTGELTTISCQIEEAKVQANLLDRLSQLYELIEDLKKTKLEDSITFYAKCVGQAEKILKEAEGSIETELHIWKSVYSEVKAQSDHLLTYLDSCWNSEIDWKRNNGLVLRLSSSARLKEIFQALYYVGQLEKLVCDLSGRILDEILVPLLNANAKIQCSEVLELWEGCEQVTGLGSLQYVLDNVTAALQHLEKHFKFQLEGGEEVMPMIGHYLDEDFCKAFVKLCLKPTLPSESSVLYSEEYIVHLNRLRAFETFLHGIGFLSLPSPIGDFADNVDIFYADKECLTSLTKAREIMCRDLHDSFLLEIEPTLVAEIQVEETAHLWKILCDGGTDLKSSPFSFPKCHISRSAKDLAMLIDRLVDEALLSVVSDRCSARLLYTVRSVCELYLSVIPEFHRDNIQQLPFYAAVAHNNAMYLAHWILALGSSRVVAIQGRNSKVPLMDLVSKFRQMAAQIFLDNMKKQRDQLVCILKEGGFNRLGGESRLPPSTEKATKQCLHHLRNLQRIWQDVLPEQVYMRAIGTLSNSVLEELLMRVTALEDIPAQAAIQLAEQCQTICKALPLLFNFSKETEDPKNMIGLVIHSIPLWGRFQELEHLLRASLRDIEDRWSSGKGPLAAHFAADEVKQMIRALFQNTDHRAAILARIK